LQPYEGGDDLIFGVHHFDLGRKHRRLGIQGAGYGTGIGNASFKELVILGIPRLTGAWQMAAHAKSGEGRINFYPIAVFEDPASLVGQNIITVASSYIDKVQSIVDMFK
jgi:hypothetical protein